MPAITTDIIEKRTITTELIKKLMKIQHDKWQLLRKIENPGFLEILLVTKDEEKIRKNMQITNYAITYFIRLTKQQQNILRNFKKTKINIALSNELSLYADILEALEQKNLPKTVDLIENEISLRMTKTQAEIRKI